ncbi:MAG: tetratricopeptide repeat protein, partial [Bacteroidota bacterium]
MLPFKTYTYRLFNIFVFLTWAISLNANEIQQDSLSYSDILKNAREIRYRDPDTAITILQNVHEEALQKGDTVSAVYALLEMPFSYGQRVDYSKSYDSLWHALFLADDVNNDFLRATVYGLLGRLYSFYKRKEQAFEYLQISLDIRKKLVKEGLLDRAYLVDTYYLMSSTYRELDEPKMAKVYLDSCFAYYEDVP